MEEIVDDPSPVQDATNSPPPKKPLSEDLRDLRAQRAKNVTVINAAVLTTIKRQMRDYETTGERGKYLEKIRLALRSISPTSVEAERAFRDDLHSYYFELN